MDSVVWIKDGMEVNSDFIQTQALTDTVSATYEHTLSSNRVDDFVGSLTCNVSDVDGVTDSRTLVIGKFYSMRVSYCQVS